jgi:hypothetical protein
VIPVRRPPTGVTLNTTLVLLVKEFVLQQWSLRYVTFRSSSSNQLVEPEPAPPSPLEEKVELLDLKASIDEIRLVQEAQGVQVAQLLEAMTALARHAVRTPLRANSYFEPSGATAQVPPMAQHVSPTNMPVNISSHHSEQAAPVVPGCDSLADVNLSLSHANPLTCPGVPSMVAPSSQFAFQLSSKEALASLQTFGGGSDKSASVLDHDSFIEFQEWFSASLWKLSAAGVPATAHAALLAQKLTGPLQKLFIREQDSASVDIAMRSANVLRSTEKTVCLRVNLPPDVYCESTRPMQLQGA